MGAREDEFEYVSLFFEDRFKLRFNKNTSILNYI